jgi:uncharacterized protein (DUF1501 family)
VLQIGSDSAGKALGLHPRLTGLQTIFNQGRLAIIQRAGYQNSSRSHFQGTDIWGSADPNNSSGTGWLGRYLDTLPSPIDPLAAWNTSGATYRALTGSTIAVPSITDPRNYSFASPNSGAEAINERNSAIRLASMAGNRPHLAFVNTSAMEAFATLDRVGSVVNYTPSVTYPNNGFGQALRTVAGSISRGIGTRVLLGADRRLRHALGPGQRGRRRVRHVDVNGRRRTAGVLQRPAEPGTAGQHAHDPVLRVRPPHLRKRQPGGPIMAPAA